MRRKYLLSAALLAVSTVVSVAPAAAVVIPTGSSGLLFDPFNVSTRGTQLAYSSVPGASSTIAGLLSTAVYRNTLGTLDFYFQVSRTGGTNEIGGINAGDYTGFTVEGFTDGTGTAMGFVTPMNPPASTTTVGRSGDGDVIRIAFNGNGLSGTERSTVYVLRTNASNFIPGLATVTNSQSFNAAAFQPTGAPVPEPATWAMMIGGFGAVGMAMRRRRQIASVLA